MKSQKNKVSVLNGEFFKDHRGIITSLNDFRFPGVERVYFIHHSDTAIIRGWHAHQFEKKWFYCVKGAFTVAFVEVDDWEKPSAYLDPQIFEISDVKSQILCVPEGYANCIKAKEENSILMVFSGKILKEALNDSWRYDSTMWVDWSKY